MFARFYRVSIAALPAVLVAAASMLPAAAAQPPANIRGTVVATSATSLTVQTPSGPATVTLTPKTGYAAANAGSPADIKPGTFLGIASVSDGATSRALEVTVFPESMRGVGEGDYPWDLSAGGSHSKMTNGSVAVGAEKRTHSSMTNATAVSGKGNVVTMKYAGGSRIVTIPPNVPIVKLAPGSRALLAKGAHVFVVPQRGAAGAAAVFVVVGQQGTVPPM